MDTISDRRARWKELGRRVELRDELDAQTAQIATLRSELSELRREVQATMMVDLSLATTVTAFFLLGTVVGGIVCAKDSNPLLIYDYFAYAFPIASAWAVGLGLYVRKWIFSAFKASVAFLLAGLVCYFAAHKLLPAFIAAMIGFAGITIASLLLFVPRSFGSPPRSQGLTVFYGVLFTLHVTLFGLWAVLVLPRSNDWMANVYRLLPEEIADDCKRQKAVDNDLQHGQCNRHR